MPVRSSAGTLLRPCGCECSKEEQSHQPSSTLPYLILKHLSEIRNLKDKKSYNSCSQDMMNSQLQGSMASRMISRTLGPRYTILDTRYTISLTVPQVANHPSGSTFPRKQQARVRGKQGRVQDLGLKPEDQQAFKKAEPQNAL